MSNYIFTDADTELLLRVIDYYKRSDKILFLNGQAYKKEIIISQIQNLLHSKSKTLKGKHYFFLEDALEYFIEEYDVPKKDKEIYERISRVIKDTVENLS